MARPTASDTAAVAVGAALGAVARWTFGEAAAQVGALPVATLVVNVLGSFAMGLLIGRWSVLGQPSRLWAPFLASGFLGGFTTFSAYAVDVVLLIETGRTAVALLYLLVTLFAGLLAVRAGRALAIRGAS